MIGWLSYVNHATPITAPAPAAVLEGLRKVTQTSMKANLHKFSALFIAAISAGCVFIDEAKAQVNVRGYTRSDGSYVQPYQRTAPDNTRSNNYSYQGNYNPNSGKTTGGGSYGGGGSNYGYYYNR